VISAENITKALFSGDIAQLSESELVEALHDVPTTVVTGQAESSLVDLLVETKAAPSRRQARQDIESGAVYVNGVRTTDLEAVITAEQRLHGKFVVLRRGKKTYFLVRYEA